MAARDWRALFTLDSCQAQESGSSLSPSLSPGETVLSLHQTHGHMLAVWPSSGSPFSLHLMGFLSDKSYRIVLPVCDILVSVMQWDRKRLWITFVNGTRWCVAMMVNHFSSSTAIPNEKKPIAHFSKSCFYWTSKAVYLQGTHACECWPWASPRSPSSVLDSNIFGMTSRRRRQYFSSD